MRWFFLVPLGLCWPWVLSAPSQERDPEVVNKKNTQSLPATTPENASRFLPWIPADATSFSAVYRNREFRSILDHSKAWNRFIALPFVKEMREKSNDNEFRGSFPNGLDWLDDLFKWWGLRDNRELNHFLKDLLAEEVFCFGIDTWKQWLMAFDEVEAHNLLSPFTVEIRGKPGQEQSLWVGFGVGNRRQRHYPSLVKFLAQVENLKTPELVAGFKLGDVKAARKKLKKLTGMWTEAVRNFPNLKSALKKTRLAGHDFFTVELGGEQISWENLPVPEAISTTKDWETLVSRLRKLKITVSFGIRDGYLLGAIGQDTRQLEGLGRKARLIDRPELKPLLQNLNQRLLEINYVSADARISLDPGRKAVDKTFAWLLELLGKTDLPPDLAAKVRKDLQGLSGDLKKFALEPGSLLEFNFLTDQGKESYTYDWSKNPMCRETRPLSLLDHVGGKPLLFILGRSRDFPERYGLATKWIQTIHSYVEELVVPTHANEKKYKQAMARGRPIISRLDEVTRTMLLPALADGQIGLVVDARLKSRRWHSAMKLSPTPLPLLEPALLVGVSDAPLLRKAVAKYRTLANDLLALEEEAEFHIPAPAMEKAPPGRMFYYPLPEPLGLDGQIRPTMGLGKQVAVLALSKKNAERLLAKKSLQLTDRFWRTPKPLTGATYVNGAGLLRAVRPWVKLGMRESGTEKDMADQVEEVLKILAVFRSYSSLTYPEDGAMVTHDLLVLRELD